ncbi:MAG TPA: PEP/pyruvate-binding domain-containing protein [Candidatus Hydrogenedentes bacterium]|nr:PEP/pyruvate-binding domain-containing protein [Candidatus Hydrogenedentota bacterium]HPG68012.1 PEP/pyruvate-binding domain-containing protein [Candidatus Hydrogenedentota bacterium]
MRFIYEPERGDATDALRIGGKARGLLALARAGVPVPPWCVIPVDEAMARPWRAEAGAVLELHHVFATLGAPPFDGIAVRSSAEPEDTPQYSFAGLFDTHFAPTPDAVIAAVEQVVNSADSPRLAAYLQHHGIDEAPEVAVVLQSKVEPVVAGVLFSANPNAAAMDRCYIEIVNGENTGLVDGEADPSLCEPALASDEPWRIVQGADGPADLDAEIVKTLVSHLRRIEDALERAVDVEWAFDGRQVWILQARPITAMQAAPALRPSFCVTSWFFDQRFTEPIRPLTRTTLIPVVIDVALKESVGMLRRAVPKPLEFDYGGQVYIAHELYRRMFLGVPQWYLSPDLRQLFPDTCHCEAPTHGIVRALGHTAYYFFVVLHAILANRHESLEAIPSWNVFRERLPGLLQEVDRAKALGISSWRARWDTIERLSEACLRVHRWSLLWADYGHRGFHVALRAVPKTWATWIERSVFSNLDFPTRRANEALASALDGDANAMARVRAMYGHRSESLDLAVPTWAEGIEDGTLAEAYAHVRNRPSIEPRPSLSRAARTVRALFRPLARLIEMREEQRFEWERILAAQRRMILEAADELARRGALERVNDVWFMEWRELTAALFDGAAVSQEAVARRRRAHWICASVDKPPFIGPGEPARPEPGPLLHGIGVSPGRATASAMVVPNPHEAHRCDLAGAILVTPTLDPAQTAVLTQVAGVVLERGGMLSHAAILAREYGVPMVTAVDCATRRIPQGAKLIIDGTTGHVTQVLL